MLTIPVNHDHQNVKKDLLILKCTCHLKTLSYCLQMPELPVNNCILYKCYKITGHTIQNYTITGQIVTKYSSNLCIFVNIYKITQ